MQSLSERRKRASIALLHILDAPMGAKPRRTWVLCSRTHESLMSCDSTVSTQDSALLDEASLRTLARLKIQGESLVDAALDALPKETRRINPKSDDDVSWIESLLMKFKWRFRKI